MYVCMYVCMYVLCFIFVGQYCYKIFDSDSTKPMQAGVAFSILAFVCFIVSVFLDYKEHRALEKRSGEATVNV